MAIQCAFSLHHLLNREDHLVGSENSSWSFMELHLAKTTQCQVCSTALILCVQCFCSVQNTKASSTKNKTKNIKEMHPGMTCVGFYNFKWNKMAKVMSMLRTNTAIFSFSSTYMTNIPHKKVNLIWTRQTITISLQLSHASAGISFSLVFSPASRRMAASGCTLINWSWFRLMCFLSCSTVTEHREGELTATGRKASAVHHLLFSSLRSRRVNGESVGWLFG